MRLTKSQEKILATSGNLIVKASAGTGKTFTLVNKIVIELEGYTGFKSIAAITFTIKAAQEIRDRLTVDATNHFIGTNNSFVIEEVIKPFMKDVYGMQYDLDLDTDYSEKISNYNEGLDRILNDNLLCSYENSMRKNFIFELALNIVKKSKACQLYLIAKYQKFYIDEYQDCDKEMHAFFMYLCDGLEIDTFVVGDEKQSIYMWRGAYPEAFMSIWGKDNFSKIPMRDNFRSCPEIQNYSNLLCEDTRELFDSSVGGGNDNIILLKTTNDSWPNRVLDLLEDEQSTAILRYSNENAKNNAKILTEHGRPFIYIPPIPIADISTSSAWLYMAIAQYLLVDKYSTYDFINEIPVEGENSRKAIHSIKARLDAITNQDDFLEFSKAVSDLANYLGYSTQDNHIKKLYNTIKNEIFHSAIIKEQEGDIAITFHSSKGLEFDQIIIFAEDYRLNDSSSIYNHYVASTRAKNRLIIVHNPSSYSLQFCRNLNHILLQSGLSINDVVTIK